MTDPTGATRDQQGDREGVPAAPGPSPRPPGGLLHSLGRAPQGLDARHVSVVGIVSLAFLFENYGLSMLSAAMKQIRESYGLAPSEMSELLAWIRLGAIPAFLLLPLADRIGRRRVFLVAIVGMSLGTFASGLAQTWLQFLVLQTITRAFLVAATATAVVLVAEALPARHVRAVFRARLGGAVRLDSVHLPADWRRRPDADHHERAVPDLEPEHGDGLGDPARGARCGARLHSGRMARA